MDEKELTARQQRELEYHRDHAKEHETLLNQSFSLDVIRNPKRRWWNAYWTMYSYILNCDLINKNVLVVGCGFGDDALRIAKLGANVCAFDLSPDSLAIAKKLAEREQINVSFSEMPAENMEYDDSHFDYVVCRDILHHVDIPKTMQEISRVAKPNAQLIINEVYTHSLADRVRHSHLVESFLYPKMQKYVYGTDKPYITEDERKLNEQDLKEISNYINKIIFEKHFNLFVARIFPARSDILSKADKIVLSSIKPMGRLIAGRILFSARLANHHI